MSLFERKNEEMLLKKNLDESVQLKAVIKNAIIVEGHTVRKPFFTETCFQNNLNKMNYTIKIKILIRIIRVKNN